jgi:hypothetical protein
MPRQIQSIPVTFANTGIVLKSSPDEIPLTAYMALVNVTTDRENSLSVRKGFTRLNNGLPDTPYSAYFVRDINDRQWRYAVAGGKLYVAPVEDPADNAIWPISQGNDFGPVVGGSGMSTATDPRPIWCNYTLIGLEYKPYVFVADGTVFLKHKAGDGYSATDGPARRVGIPKPKPLVAVNITDNDSTVIEDFEDPAYWTSDAATLSQESGHDGSGYSLGIVATTPADKAVFGAYKVMAANGVYPAIVDLDPTDPDGVLEFWIKFDNEEAALNCSEIVIAFGLSLSTGDVTFSTRYEKAIKPSEFEAASQPGSGGRGETYDDAMPDANKDLNYRQTNGTFDTDHYDPNDPRYRLSD